MKYFARMAAALCCLFTVVVGCSRADAPFFFVQISDPQMGFKEHGEIERSVRYLDETVQTINKLHPAFVLVTGDMLSHWDNQEELQAYKAGIAQIDKGIPVYEVPGNHDFRPVKEPGSDTAYFERFNDGKFEFWYNGSYFLGFNSNYIKDGLEAEEEEQFAWISSCLAENAPKANQVILFMHCSIIKEAVDEEEDYFNFQAPYREKYLKLCKDYGVDLVLSGHFHRTRSVLYDGTQHVTCTASGWPLGDGISGINVVGVWPDHVTWAVTSREEAVNPLK